MVERARKAGEHLGHVGVRVGGGLGPGFDDTVTLARTAPELTPNGTALHFTCTSPTRHHIKAPLNSPLEDLKKPFLAKIPENTLNLKTLKKSFCQFF